MRLRCETTLTTIVVILVSIDSISAGKLGNQGHFPLVRSSVVARQGLSNFIAKNYTTGSSSLSKQFMLKPVPQVGLFYLIWEFFLFFYHYVEFHFQLHQMLRPISTSQSHKAAVTGDHVRLWQAERIGSVILIGLLPACVLFDSPIIDASLAVIMVMHSHW